MKMLTSSLVCLLAVVGAAAEPAPFRTGILPVLTKAGCNSGACHGAATGQGGFKLSLLGYDPEEDYARITREIGGRRIDVSHPAQSLFLRKPSEDVEHEGGLKLRADSGWIRDGAPVDLRRRALRAARLAGRWDRRRAVGHPAPRHRQKAATCA
jgi:hypothetical protein